MTKKCKTCGQDKELSQYWQNPKTKDRLKTSCISCCKEYNKKHYENNRTIILERVNKSNPPEKPRFSNVAEPHETSKVIELPETATV